MKGSPEASKPKRRDGWRRGPPIRLEMIQATVNNAALGTEASEAALARKKVRHRLCELRNLGEIGSILPVPNKK